MRIRRGRLTTLLPATTMSGDAGAPPCIVQDIAEDADDLVELGLPGDERRRDLDHRVAAVVGAADEPALEEGGREEAAQQRLAFVVVEALPRLLVLDELDCVEEAGPADVAHDRQLEQRLERRSEGALVAEHVLQDPLA